MQQTSALLTVMIAAVRKASKGLARDFGEVEHLQVAKKGPSDFVSAADTRAEKILFEELSKARPGYGFLLEERGHVEGTDKTHRFIIDPLDGTLNFLHGLPHFAISVALEREGELMAGVVYDVAKNELFWAEKGRGSWLNDRRLRVSARPKLGDSVIATGIPFRGKPGHELFREELSRLTPEVAGIRRFGSAALDLAYVAAGRYDGFWERHLSPWDIAAGALLVREAGGIARELDGQDFMQTGCILAANPGLFPELSKLLRRA